VKEGWEDTLLLMRGGYVAVWYLAAHRRHMRLVGIRSCMVMI